MPATPPVFPRRQLACQPAAPSAASKASRTANVSGTINQTIDGVGTFVGSFTPSGFSAQNGQLTVTGLLQGRHLY
ncbi:hypothetical protein [Arthrobacter sp. ISL-85]|uniref:hypothetical protein n=1 Tax=Arthrobacter sp. ISL-85 TaxID=2819115 RepID=UPI00203520A2|nr:hypothetical protein [Arthrobacter sp. ISL-85]